MNKPYVYITRKVPERLLENYLDRWDIQQWLEDEKPVPPEVLKEEVKKADGIMTMLSDEINNNMINWMEKTKVIANLAVGYDNIDIDAAVRKGITVTNTPDVLTETTADLTFGLLMASARRIVEAENYIKQGKWSNWAPFLLAGSDIHHKKIGIVGMGRIGEAVAKRAKGFNMEILYHNRNRKPEVEKSMGAVYLEFEELLFQSDFVVCLAPATKETRGMFDREAFKKMKNSAIFINASRGVNVQEDDLYQAIVNKEIRAAGLDVFEKEPIGHEHPLMSLDQVICLPHIGSASVETRETMIRLCLENMDLVLQGEKAMTPVTN